MSDRGQETEVKYYVLHLEKVTARLRELQARLIQTRVLERNLRFDLPDASLSSAKRVLRLRHDTESRFTFKGPGQNKSGVLDRLEIEFVVGDFEKARQFLEALGYQKTMSYEKYRTTYELDNAQVMLDEMPYGDFVEIEGETVEQITAMSEKLNMDSKAAIATSYTGLFENIRKALQLSFQDISFENFKGINVTTEQLDVRAADE